MDQDKNSKVHSILISDVDDGKDVVWFPKKISYRVFDGMDEKDKKRVYISDGIVNIVMSNAKSRGQ